MQIHSVILFLYMLEIFHNTKLINKKEKKNSEPKLILSISLVPLCPGFGGKEKVRGLDSQESLFSCVWKALSSPSILEPKIALPCMLGKFLCAAGCCLT